MIGKFAVACLVSCAMAAPAFATGTNQIQQRAQEMQRQQSRQPPQPEAQQNQQPPREMQRQAQQNQQPAQQEQHQAQQNQQPAQQNQAQQNEQQAQKQPNQQVGQFLNKQAAGNQGEIRLGVLAEKQAEDPAVKGFARLMVDDHMALESNVAVVAGEMHVRLTDGIAQTDQQAEQKLKSMSGHQFDVTYMHDMVSGHKQVLQELQQEQSRSHNPQVRGLVMGALPIIEQHLALAQAVDQSLTAQSNVASNQQENKAASNQQQNKMASNQQENKTASNQSQNKMASNQK